MILIAFGANLSGQIGFPEQTVRAASRFLEAESISIIAASSLYLTPPVGPGRQQPYINAVAIVHTNLPPAALLNALHRVEYRCGRRRSVRWGPRVLDLDLLSYNRLVTPQWRLGGTGRGSPLVVPHPTMHLRSFVLCPLSQIAPHWVHPALGLSAIDLWRRLETSAEAQNIRTIFGPQWTE